MVRNRTADEFLETLGGVRTVVVGVGNTLKADDGFGPLVCEYLAGRVSAKVIDAGTVPENYIRPIVESRPEQLLIIDAVDFGGRPGDMRVFEVAETGPFAFSTHALSLHLFIEIIRRQVDVDVHLLGVQPGCTRLGEPVTDVVQNAIEALTEILRQTFPAMD